MLSILIPTYNYDVCHLVSLLHHQATVARIPFEIIVAEDGPTLLTQKNISLSELSHCNHIILPQNIGRSAIRNFLADTARYENLLFMDCDAAVCSTQFISRYLPFCNQEQIVIGGTAYDKDESNPDYSLRLKYGRLREARTPSERGKNNFSTFNFLIHKSIFNRVRFDESIRGYGHEDMLLGHALHQLGYEFVQIDNPLIHKGLDVNLVYLSKTEEATQNLYLLHLTGRYPFLSQESKLLSSFLKLKKISPLLVVLFYLFRPMLRMQLTSPNPSLFLYDIYKLLFLFQVASKMTR